MLVCDPSLATSNVDRMAIAHLRQAGVIFTKQPKPKAIRAPKGRIAWKSLEATGYRLNPKGCRQCGASEGHESPLNPYKMALCGRCLGVHARSIEAGLKPTDEIFW